MAAKTENYLRRMLKSWIDHPIMRDQESLQSGTSSLAKFLHTRNSTINYGLVDMTLSRRRVKQQIYLRGTILWELQLGKTTKHLWRPSCYTFMMHGRKACPWSRGHWQCSRRHQYASPWLSIGSGVLGIMAVAPWDDRTRQFEFTRCVLNESWPPNELTVINNGPWSDHDHHRWIKHRIFYGFLLPVMDVIWSFCQHSVGSIFGCFSIDCGPPQIIH